MKCLFCGQELKTIDIIHEYHCGNENCVAYQISSDYSQVWDLINGLKIKLDRTRKALDLAMGALKSIQEYGAIAMSELQKNGLGSFQKPVSKMQDMAHLAEKQINEIKGGKDD